MKTLLSALLCGVVAAAAPNAIRADDATFDQYGITFTHPKDWTVKADDKGAFKIVTAQTGKGTTVVLMLHAPEIEPKVLADGLDKQYKKVFEGKIVPGSDKPVKRKLLGAERDGGGMEIKIVEGTTGKLEYYAFQTPSKKNTISVILNTYTSDPDGAKAVEKLAESLAEKK